MSFDPTNFDPNRHKSGGNDLLPVGTYILWARSFKRKNKNGKDMILFIVEAILTSDHKRIEKDVYAPIFENVTLTAEAAFRLADLAQAVGRTTPFNVMSDREVANIFRFKPFKAKISRRTYQGKENAQIDGYLMMNGADEKAAEEVLEDQAVDNATGGYDPGGYDQHNPGEYNGGSSNGSVEGDSFNDDEIPF